MSDTFPNGQTAFFFFLQDHFLRIEIVPKKGKISERFHLDLQPQGVNSWKANRYIKASADFRPVPHLQALTVSLQLYRPSLKEHKVCPHCSMTMIG